MNKICDDNELLLMVGGFNLTGTIVNSFLNAGKFVFKLGQSFGTALRRIGSKNVCQV